jgi:hypothetical protein
VATFSAGCSSNSSASPALYPSFFERLVRPAPHSTAQHRRGVAIPVAGHVAMGTEEALGSEELTTGAVVYNQLIRVCVGACVGAWPCDRRWVRRATSRVRWINLIVGEQTLIFTRIKNGTFTAHTKHVPIRYKHAREFWLEGKTKLGYCHKNRC